jgi:hypothetical protein
MTITRRALASLFVAPFAKLFGRSATVSTFNGVPRADGWQHVAVTGAVGHSVYVNGCLVSIASAHDAMTAQQAFKRYTEALKNEVEATDAKFRRVIDPAIKRFIRDAEALNS